MFESDDAWIGKFIFGRGFEGLKSPGEVIGVLAEDLKGRVLQVGGTRASR